MMGFRAYRAHRASQRFLRHDEESMRELTERRADNAVYVNLARQRIRALEQMFEADRAEPSLERDAGWDAESLREEFRARPAAAKDAAGSSKSRRTASCTTRIAADDDQRCVEMSAPSRCAPSAS